MKRVADRWLALKLAGIVAAMFAFGFALVPLYDVLCKLTGLNGRTAAAPAVVAAAPDVSRIVRVEFVAAVARGAPWEFAPAVSHLDVHPGQLYEAQFHARNLTAAPHVAQAVPTVAPSGAAQFLEKTQCFCFTEQAFAGSEARDLTVVFTIAPELPERIGTLSLAYTLFAVKE